MDEQTEMPKKRNSSMVLVIAGVLLLAVGGLVWFASSQKSPTSTTDSTQKESSTSPTTASDTQTSAQAITVEGANFSFKPNEIRVKKGETVTITFFASGGIHDFVIDEFNVKSEQISEGSTTVTFTPDKAGTFEYYCSVGNHRAMGMKGSLIVE